MCEEASGPRPLQACELTLRDSLLQGIVLKLRYNRAGHAFEFPIVLSHLVEWPVLLAGKRVAQCVICIYVCV